MRAGYEIEINKRSEKKLPSGINQRKLISVFPWYWKDFAEEWCFTVLYKG